MIRSHSLDQNERTSTFAEFSNVQTGGGGEINNLSPGKGQTISHKTSKSLFDPHSLNIQYFSTNNGGEEEEYDDTFDDPTLSDAAKKERVIFC